MPAPRVAFVRSYDSLGRDEDDLLRLLQAGYTDVVFDVLDPYYSQGMQTARKLGLRAGIWANPENFPSKDPETFARQIAEIRRIHNPDLVMLDVEAIGKGYQNTPGWAYNEALARAIRNYLPNQRIGISVMPQQEDFNYEAYLGSLGNVEWYPQAYGANPRTQPYDPAFVADILKKRGVPEQYIYPVLANPEQFGQWDSSRGHGLWTIDDYIGQELPRNQGPTAAYGIRDYPPPESNRPIPRKPRLSQSLEQIQSAGLKWGGRVFSSKADLARWLARRGRSFDEWAQRHPSAAKALQERNLTPKY